MLQTSHCKRPPYNIKYIRNIYPYMNIKKTPTNTYCMISSPSAVTCETRAIFNICSAAF